MKRALFAVLAIAVAFLASTTGRAQSTTSAIDGTVTAGQGRTFTEHGCGGGMPQDVCTINGRLNPGPKQRRAHDMG